LQKFSNDAGSNQSANLPNYASETAIFTQILVFSIFAKDGSRKREVCSKPARKGKCAVIQVYNNISVVVS